MPTATDFTDIGILISFALQPTKRPSVDEYRRTLNRYRGEPAFRQAVDGILDGLSVRVLSDGDYGLIIGVTPESPFAFRAGDFPNTADAWKRLMAGLVLAGLAAFAFPTAEDLNEERVRQLQDAELERWLRAKCEQLKSHDAAGEVIPDEGLDHAWRLYANMPETMVGERGRGSGRLSANCTLYWVRHVFSWLTEQGMARPDTSSGDGHWYLNERFRMQVRNMGVGSAFQYLRDLTRATKTDHKEGCP